MSLGPGSSRSSARGAWGQAGACGRLRDQCVTRSCADPRRSSSASKRRASRCNEGSAPRLDMQRGAAPTTRISGKSCTACTRSSFHAHQARLAFSTRHRQCTLEPWMGQGEPSARTRRRQARASVIGSVLVIGSTSVLADYHAPRWSETGTVCTATSASGQPVPVFRLRRFMSGCGRPLRYWPPARAEVGGYKSAKPKRRSTCLSH